MNGEPSTVPEEDAGTFRDRSLPVRERLKLLAAFLRSDLWAFKKFPDAANLILEVEDLLAVQERAAEQRVAALERAVHLVRELQNVNRQHQQKLAFYRRLKSE